MIFQNISFKLSHKLESDKEAYKLLNELDPMVLETYKYEYYGKVLNKIPVLN